MEFTYVGIVINIIWKTDNSFDLIYKVLFTTMIKLELWSNPAFRKCFVPKSFIV